MPTLPAPDVTLFAYFDASGAPSAGRITAEIVRPDGFLAVPVLVDGLQFETPLRFHSQYDAENGRYEVAVFASTRLQSPGVAGALGYKITLEGMPAGNTLYVTPAPVYLTLSEYDMADVLDLPALPDPPPTPAPGTKVLQSDFDAQVAAQAATDAAQDEQIAALFGAQAAFQTWSEVPAGALDGSNAVFTLLAAPSAGTLRLYLNGLRQSGGGNDFTLAGNAITFTAAPRAGDALLCDYNHT